MERRPRFADDRWYPSTPQAMDAKLDTLLPVGASHSAVAVVAPHAGWTYSGAIAGALFARLTVPDRIVLIGPNHRGKGARVSVWPDGAWTLPGRSVPVDAEAVRRLRAHAPRAGLEVTIEEDPRAHADEHSLELLLPFCVARNPGVSIVPICTWPLSFDACETLGNALATTIEELPGPTLIVASSDLNHYDPASVSGPLDRLAIDRMRALDAPGLYETVRDREISMCGVVPATIAMIAAARLGATHGDLVRYGDSGDVTGDKSHVVGYASIEFN